MGAVGVKALVHPFFCYATATATKTAIANTTATATATKTATKTATATKTKTRKPPLFISNIKTGQSYDQVRRDHYQTY